MKYLQLIKKMFDSALYDNYEELCKSRGGWGGEGKRVKIRKPNPIIAE